MIERVQNIQNIGRIAKTGGGRVQYQFNKNTHIYAGNTHGKSTFTAITRSLQTNDPDFIKGRKTFGSTSPQLALQMFGVLLLIHYPSYKIFRHCLTYKVKGFELLHQR
jgi:hypothetical protein